MIKWMLIGIFSTGSIVTPRVYETKVDCIDSGKKWDFMYSSWECMKIEVADKKPQANNIYNRNQYQSATWSYSQSDKRED